MYTHIRGFRLNPFFVASSHYDHLKPSHLLHHLIPQYNLLRKKKIYMQFYTLNFLTSRIPINANANALTPGKIVEKKYIEMAVNDENIRNFIRRS